MRRISGEKIMRKVYRAFATGAGGVSVGVVLNPIMEFAPRDLVQYSALGDGSFRVWRVKDKKHARVR
jgi:hypothetical protein